MTSFYCGKKNNGLKIKIIIPIIIRAKNAAIIPIITSDGFIEVLSFFFVFEKDIIAKVGNNNKPKIKFIWYLINDNMPKNNTPN